MTKQQIAALPTIKDINNWQLARIAELQACGNYNTETREALMTERANIVYRETVCYAGIDGDDGYEVVYGNTREVYIKTQAILNRKGVA
jgi:hypothetical protein